MAGYCITTYQNWYYNNSGATHGLEIAFVFDTLDHKFKPFMGSLLGTVPPQQLADKMHTAWIAFATNGNPGWSKYDLSRRLCPGGQSQLLWSLWL
jgi:carboxylesterase type B